MPSPEPRFQAPSASPIPTTPHPSAPNRPTDKPTDRARTIPFGRESPVSTKNLLHSTRSPIFESNQATRFDNLEQNSPLSGSRIPTSPVDESSAMASTTYFGRVKHGERRLGDDFDLLAKWARAFSGDYAIHSYYLTQLSAEDRAKLFSGPAKEFRLEQGPDNTVKLESLQDEVDRIDPEVIDMIRSPGYQRSEARRLELLNAIEDAHHKAEGAAALALSSALMSGVDGPPAEEYSRRVAMEYRDGVAVAVKARWRAERDDRLKGANKQAFADLPKQPGTAAKTVPVDQMMAEAAPYAAFWRTLPGKQSPGAVDARATSQSTTVKQEDTQRNRNVADSKVTFTLDTTSAELEDDQPTPRQRFAAKFMSPHDSIPEYGSETSVETAHWNSPTFSAGEIPSSPEIDPQNEPIDDSDGGVSLLPSDLAEELGFKVPSSAATPTPASQRSRFGTHTAGGHLGAGLQQAFVAISGSIKEILADATLKRASNGASLAAAPSIAVSKPINPRVAHQQLVDQFVKPTQSIEASLPAFTANTQEEINAWHAHKQLIDDIVHGKSTVDAFSGSASHVVGGTALSVAKEQPWKGFTCYEVATTKLSIDQLVPKYWTTRAEKERYTRHKIGELKLDDAKLRSDRFTGSVARNPVHIFIDLSNIIIGFYDSMKESRGIPVTKRVMAPPFSFKNFDTILTRDRNVAKRVVAGSLANSYKRWPSYMLQAQELQYEMNILERVPKPAGSPVRKRRAKAGARDLDVSASGADTSGEDYLGAPMKNGEQGVDELLHLKILQSAMDTSQPATMVLATGDAATAQYSDGFKKNIERVLAVGWNIELYGWRRNISAAWREPEFAQQWGHQFKIIELDGFCEELFDMTIESLEL